MKLQNFNHSCNPYVSLVAQSSRVWREDNFIPQAILDQPICLEVGCAHGVMLKRIAEKNPDINFLGNDYKYKEAYLSSERCSHLRNVFVVKSKVQNLVRKLPLNYLSSVISFYPDPWPKRKQQKNRIWDVEFVKSLIPKLKNGAPIFLKTDQLDYFEQMKRSFEGVENFLVVLDGNYSPRMALYDEAFKSFFEELFFKQQEHSYFLIALTQKSLSMDL